MLKNVIPGSTSRLTTVDHKETYGRHVLLNHLPDMEIKKCLDLGCGKGADLQIIKQKFPDCECYGIDFGDWNKDKLIEKGIKPLSVNIESEKLPFKTESIDLIICNQVLEHTKEIYWINHEIFRCLKIGGGLYLGVPNILSFHNRLLGFLGYHPTQFKMISAHIRTFSKRDLILFYNTVAGSFASIDGFYGSQFYPFPKPISRFFATIFPNSAFSIFFFIRKSNTYKNQFIEWPKTIKLETNFFTGEINLEPRQPDTSYKILASVGEKNQLSFIKRSNYKRV